MRIKLKIIRSVGVIRVYPQCETSRKLLDLVGQKSFTERQVNILLDLGYEVEVVKKGKDLE